MAFLSILSILKSKFVYIPLICIVVVTTAFISGAVWQHKREATKEAKVIVKEVIKYVDKVEKVRERYRLKPFTPNEILSGRASERCKEEACK